MRWTVRIGILVGLVHAPVVWGAGGHGTDWQPGASLCVLLGPADFAADSGATAPEDNGDGSGGHYCAYVDGRSGAQGGIEFDAFVGADAATTYATVVSEMETAMVDAKLPGADVSAIGVAERVSASIVVRRGALVFALTMPKSATVESELRRLAALVLSRAGKAVAR